MIKELKYPYENLTKLEKERIDLFRNYNFSSYDDIHVYYITELRTGAGYNIIVSLHEIKNTSDIKHDDTTKDITDIDNLLHNF